MKRENILPTERTYVLLLAACAELNNLEMGKEIHNQLSSNSQWLENETVHNSLVAMYLKCNLFDAAIQISIKQ